MFQSKTLIFALVILIVGCKKPDGDETMDPSDGTYFSILQFAEDQYQIYKGQPFTLERFIYLNGDRDSTLIPAPDIDWASVVRTFAKTDISDSKYLGQYNFSVVEDDITISRIFYYEAKDPNLYTKSLQIITDPENHKIKSIYIEAAEDNWFSERTQRLYYAPEKILQIQESEHRLFGRDKDLRIEYRFLY